MLRRTTLLIGAVGLATSGLALGQTAPDRASTTATGSVRVLQPAMISTSQDLMFAAAAPLTAGLTTVSTRVSTPGTGAGGGGRTSRRPTGASALTASSPFSALVPTPAQATFLVAGDAGQSISVTVPAAIDLTRAGGVETAQLTTTDTLADGPQFLGGNFATAGTLSFNVGGQVTLANNVATGTYRGVLAVVAQYN